ncbi:hypothetical protein DFJ58DRAFT_769982 [Suillus subalutaceus]|uniref:uncharacterized protein n=1 Tax=Suillus subalutaceus TaxID=48586 RepID=UPI001B873487|nr:uncharacterized protein DFJ58DRAFT_769982 [Suillus subalutaceus]KAG1866631.1 hypothetical protein DFJ58DRAFT_769982 [Suillus subalutaceus]
MLCTMILSSLSLLGLTSIAMALAPPLTVQYQFPTAISDNMKVPVVLGVMSRCPDAILCESVFNRVLQRVGQKVEISLSFIAKPNASEPYGVTCMHGQAECAGNVQELCAAKYHTTAEWWSFMQCQNFQGSDNIGTPETALNCANAAGIDWENGKAGRCAGKDGRGTEGIQLLQQSARDSIAAGIQKSCTIIINGQQVCIRDGTWYDCEGGHSPGDFIRQINEEYDRLNSAG